MPTFSEYYPQIARVLMCEPWAIRPDVHAQLVQQLEAHAAARAGATVKADGVNEWRQARGLDRMWEYDDESGHGLLRVRGIIGRGLSALDMECGGVCLDQVTDALGELAEMEPQSVTVHLTTPGGTVTGIPEAAAAFREFNGQVAPLHAYADVQCCSAGYWLAACCETFTAAPSATVGSIGVFTAALSSSKAAELRGYRVHLISSGKYKGAGTFGTDMTEEQLEFLRERVAGITEDFHGAVRAGRKRLKAEHMEGQMWYANRAPEGVHDGLVPSLRQHLAEFLRRG